MREIKFKFYDPVEKRLVALANVFDTALYPYLANRTLIPCQFTGLKDKNGKEIYEGDIGKSVDDVLWRVEYDVVLARFIGIYDGNVIEDLSEIHDNMEIIGNIYENPELLDKSKEV